MDLLKIREIRRKNAQVKLDGEDEKTDG